jgi:hypothetical protein
MKKKISLLAAALLLGACQTHTVGTSTAGTPRVSADRFGVMVMAHGGSKAWNEQVQAAVAPLKTAQPTALALGMADANTMAVAVKELEAQGVNRIGVLRGFISGESFLTETEQILGLREGAPAAAAVDPHAGHAGHGSHGTSGPNPPNGGGHSMGFFRLDSKAAFQLSPDGLLDAPEMGVVLADRALEISTAPTQEDVLILAHGPADDGENARWMKKLEARADSVRQAAPFRRVQVVTLREDWPEKRAEAERAIRAYVERAKQENGRALVLSYRVAGFGPYHEVLKGLDYTANEKGLLPHKEVSLWLEREAKELAAAR